MRYRRVAVLLAGFALDAALGDPHGWPHPVRLMGRQIALEERIVRDRVLPRLASGYCRAKAPSADDARARRRTGVAHDLPKGIAAACAHVSGLLGFPAVAGSAGGLPGASSDMRPVGGLAALDERSAGRIAGAGIAFTVVLSAGCAGWLVSWVARRLHPLAGLAIESLLCYQLLAARSLQDESTPVFDALAAGDIPAARRALSMIVGRDVQSLDETGIVRAAVETVAENASDGVVAPLLAMGLGGLPGMLCYKAANTLDSMIGYKDDRYRDLGWAAAKLDDLANFAPARAAGALMCLAAGPAGFDGSGAWRVFARDRLNHASPNAGHTEAACAGALGVQLGGTASYFGKMVDKPTIGDAARPLEAGDIPRANRLMRATSLLGLGAAVLLALVLGRRGR